MTDLLDVPNSTFETVSVLRRTEGWRALVLVRRDEGSDSSLLQVVMHLRDPEGFLRSDDEWYRMDRLDGSDWTPWLERRADALIAEFRFGRDHQDADEGLPPHAVERLAETGGPRRAFSEWLLPDELVADDLDEHLLGDDFAKAFPRYDKRADPAFDYLMRRETADWSRSFAEHRPWILSCSPAGDLMRALVERGFPPDCTAEAVASVVGPGVSISYVGTHVTAAAVRSVDMFHAMPGAASPRKMLRFLSLLPPDWMPADRKSYVAASQMTKILRAWWCPGEADRFQVLLADCRGRWPEYVRRLQALPASENGLGAGFGDVADMINDFGRRIVAPAYRRLHGLPIEDVRSGDVACAVLCEGVGLATILRRSNEWHRRYRTLSGGGTDVPPWEPLTPPFLASNGLEVAFLTDATSLAEEGDAMDHCVGSYALDCWTGTADVASVRRVSDGERMSTFEVAFPEGRMVVVQHKGPRNAAPPPDAVSAVDDWIASFAGRTPEPRETRTLDELDGPAGDPAEWKGILPSRLRRMTAEEIVGTTTAKLGWMMPAGGT